MDENDFLIPDMNIRSESLQSRNDTDKNVVSYYINRSEYNLFNPIRFLKKNDRFQEPFIFFGKQIDINPYSVNTHSYIYQHYKPIVYYEYVAFNKGITLFKSAVFKKIYITRINSNKIKYSFSDVLISKIPIEALEQLRDFIIYQRQQDPTFCKTIYKAVVEVLGPQQQNNE